MSQPAAGEVVAAGAGVRGGNNNNIITDSFAAKFYEQSLLLFVYAIQRETG